MAASNSPDGAGRDDIPDGTVVTALRAGWNEQLTPEQEYDLIPVTDPDVPRGSEFLRGPLRRVYVDIPDIGEIVVTLVGGQEADPDTIERAEAVANTDQPRDEKGQFASAGSNIAEDYYAAYAAAYGEGSKGLKPRERTAAVKRYKAALKAWRAAGSPERSAPSPSSAQQGTARPTTTTAATAARIKELAAASRYGTVRVADLHEALGKPDLASLHSSLQKMRRSGAIEMSELEGRGGVDPRDEATALRTPSSRGHEARLGYIDVRDPEAFARHL